MKPTSPPIPSAEPQAPLSTTWRRVAVASLMTAGLVFALAGRAATITASLDREVIGLGSSATLKVTIQGGNGRDLPRIPDVPGVRVQLTGNSMSFVFENGRQSVAADLTYSVTPSKLGQFTVGPVTAVVGGRTLQAEPLTLKVVRADDPSANRADGLDQAAFLLLQVPHRPVYVGETFLAEIGLYAIGGRLQQAPQMQADGFTVGKLQEAGQEGNIRTNNRIYSRARFLQPITAARAGQLTLQAAQCIIDIPQPRRLGFSDLFDDAFFGNSTRRFNLASPVAKLNVLPLPRTNLPPDFGGAVGDFQIALTASPTNLQAGDPVTVRLEIRGRGNFDSVQLAEPPGWKGFRLYPPTSTFETQDPLGMTGTKRFEQVVTPETAEVTELPPFVFSFFSPETGSYRTLRTPRVPLLVAAGPATPELPTTADHSAAPRARTPEIPPLKPHLGFVVGATPSIADQPWFLALAGVPWTLWAALRATRRWRERRAGDRERQRRLGAERRVREGLATLRDAARRRDETGFFAGLFRVLQEVVGARSGQPPASITEGALDASLVGKGLPPETLASLHELFQACNQARYARAGTGADLEELRQRTETLCAELLRGG